MKITFINGGKETEIKTNDNAQFEKFTVQIKSILDGSDQYKYATFMESNYIDYTFSAGFILGSMIKIDYATHS